MLGKLTVCTQPALLATTLHRIRLNNGNKLTAIITHTQLQLQLQSRSELDLGLLVLLGSPSLSLGKELYVFQPVPPIQITPA